MSFIRREIYTKDKNIQKYLDQLMTDRVVEVPPHISFEISRYKTIQKLRNINPHDPPLLISQDKCARVNNSTTTEFYGYDGTNWNTLSGRNGNTSVANNGTITHGLGFTPTMVQVTTTRANLTASVIAISSATFKVRITDVKTGLDAGGVWYIHWYAKV